MSYSQLPAAAQPAQVATTRAAPVVRATAKITVALDRVLFAAATFYHRLNGRCADLAQLTADKWSVRRHRGVFSASGVLIAFF